MLCGTYEDLIYAYRRMMGQPGFTFVAVLILAVGIGVTTAMSSTIKAALLSRLPFDEPDCLVMGRATFDRNVNPWVSGYDYYDYKEQSQSFESLSALFAFGNRVTVVGGAEPERIAGGFVTWDLFHTLRVRPAVGRLFAAEEGAAGRSNVVMISYGYWQRRFGGSPDVVGSTLIVNGNPLTIIGVMPAGFYFLDNLDIWRLTYYNGPGAQARRWRNLLLVGRLKPGITIQQAQSEMDLISRRLEEQYPDTNKGKALLVTGLHDTMIEDVRTSLLMLMVAVSLVLLLACGNVAGLLLAKGQSRLRELAIRSAMGGFSTPSGLPAAHRERSDGSRGGHRWSRICHRVPGHADATATHGPARDCSARHRRSCAPFHSPYLDCLRLTVRCSACASEHNR